MDAPALFDLLADGPVIAAVKDGDGLSAALESSVPVIFLLYGDILTVGEAAARCHAAGKAVFVHLDLVEGLAQKEIAADFIARSQGVPRCPVCGGIVKPDVVLYEEGLDEQVLSGAVNAIRRADTLIIGGTSLVVYPAAGLIRYFQGDHLVVINLQPTAADRQADLCIAQPIGQVLSEEVRLD